ncbi:MAG TPA: hypothetical protein VMZ69_01650 [Saprospiraceae bacterium]|nr:hypothetical protein [Saprospiraceae bacterium]
MKKITLLISWLVIPFFCLHAQFVGVGTLAPLAKFHVEIGTNDSDGILFTGVLTKGTGFPSLGAGNRFMFYPARAALRAGVVTGTHWDNVRVGVASTAFGVNTIGRNAATTATGYENSAGGFASSVFGSYNVAKGYSSMVVGQFNDSLIVGSDEDEVLENTPLFIIGNGDGIGATPRNNAMVVFKNGNLLLKNQSIVNGSPGSFNLPVSGAGTRMMWLSQKSAFRAGTAEGAQWDASTIGTWSFAGGLSTTASGLASTAFGSNTIASGLGSASFGISSTASGVGAFTSGFETKASAPQTTAMGVQNAARGHFSFSSGNNNIAKGFSSTVIGMYNDSILTANEPLVSATTPLFIIGNGDGTSAGQRKNAMVVRKDGRVGISTNIPAAKLDVAGSAANPTIPGLSSTGIARFEVTSNEGVDIGKMGVSPYSSWIQSGYNGTTADPLTLQPAGGIVGIGTSTPLTSAALDVTSTTKGFLPPRMLLAQRNLISTPAAGLMIWCSNCGIHGQLQVYNGISWTNMNGAPTVPTPDIGVRDGGGIIAYILQAGDPGYIAGEVHGLITTEEDEQIIGTPYGCNGTNIPGAEGTALGTGLSNTTDIVNGCSSGYAAQACYDFVLEGFSDWYLPSKDELNKLYLNRVIIGGFNGGFYWSSSEISSTNAWSQDFSTGGTGNQSKNFSFDARAIRKF